MSQSFSKRVELQATQQMPTRPECQAVWLPDLLAARVTVRKGKALAGSQLPPAGHDADILRLEDVLYLAERGTLALWRDPTCAERVAVPEVWRSLVTEGGGGGGTGEIDILDTSEVSIECSKALDNYIVFSHLKRAGYRVCRPSDMDGLGWFEGAFWHVREPVSTGSSVKAAPLEYRVWVMSDFGANVWDFLKNLGEYGDEASDVVALVDGNQVCMLSVSAGPFELSSENKDT
jgi:hypothetical protein